MRDIGTRIRRYRLTRYGPSHPTLLRRMRWVLPVLALWLAYVTFLSEHSIYRIWRLSRDEARMRSELEATRQEIERLEHEDRDPAARRQHAERLLRERSGWAREGEIIYRIPAQGRDSVLP